MSFAQLLEERAPISIHLNKEIACLIVLNSLKHPDDPETKEVLRNLGYRVQVSGNIYTITDPMIGPNDLDRLKTGLEITYGIVPKPITLT